MFACPATDDFFRARLDHMIDLRQPLVVLASHMPWQALEARVAQTFSRRAHTGEPDGAHGANAAMLTHCLSCATCTPAGNIGCSRSTQSSTEWLMCVSQVARAPVCMAQASATSQSL